jgi:hypothetical protein
MDSKIKIQLTSSGEQRLESLNAEIKELVLNIIKNAKYAPGDDFIEVTASDIEKVANRLKIIQPQKSQIRQLLILSYSILGVLLTIIGFFYEQFKDILNDDPTRLMLVVMGLLLSFFSGFFSIYLKQKQKQEKELLDVELEKRKISEIYSIIQSNERNTEVARTQYNDLTGTAALDFHGSLTELWDTFKEQGIDLNIYEPFGISVYYGETNFFNISLLAIDKQKSSVSDSLRKSKIPVISISLNMDKQNFERLFKRFHILLSKSRYGQDFEIINETDIEQIKTSHNNV